MAKLYATTSKIAIVYDRINKWGGAERLLLNLHQLYPDAPIYTLVHNPKSSKWAKDIQVIPSFFNRVPFFRKKHELLAPVASFGFERFNFDQFDLVISVTSDAAKAVVTKPHTLHICYCLTPTRYLWSGIKEYKKSPGLRNFSQLASFGLHRFKNSLRKADFIFAQRSDHYLAISQTVQKRIQKYYQRDSDLIYPGIDYKFWSAIENWPLKIENYYLVVSRLVPYKKVSLVIKAFSQPETHNLKLVIVGTGSQKLLLKSISGPNVEFLGKVSDQKLRSLYQHAQALIFPQNEDFGLTPLEAQACGTPVIAFKKGGALETVVPGKTGLLFVQQTSQSLLKAIARFQKQKSLFTASNCQANARRFDHSLFLSKFSAKVDSLYSNCPSSHANRI